MNRSNGGKSFTGPIHCKGAFHCDAKPVSARDLGGKRVHVSVVLPLGRLVIPP